MLSPFLHPSPSFISDIKKLLLSVLTDVSNIMYLILLTHEVVSGQVEISQHAFI